MAVRYNAKKAAERGYTKKDWDAVSDNPPITKADMAKAKPFKEALPELYESIQRSRGRPKSDDPKQAFTLRLPQSVLERWQRDPDWRAKMAETLEKAI